MTANHYAPASRQHSDWDKSRANADAGDPYWTPCDYSGYASDPDSCN
jgi:hypothetical protein